MFKLRKGQGREGVFDRGAEDCEEGAEGEPGEEALRGRTHHVERSGRYDGYNCVKKALKLLIALGSVIL